MAKNYDAPDAGSAPGGYGSPTPHAAAVSHEPYTAPSGGQAGSGPSHGAFDAMDSAPSWTPTPGEAMESPERFDV